MVEGPFMDILFSHAGLRDVSELAEALDTCARSAIADVNAPEARLPKLLLHRNTLDYFSGSVLTYDLNGTVGELDTIQITNQCAMVPGSNMRDDALCKQAIEIWDVRTLGRNREQQLPQGRRVQGPRLWSLPNGTNCSLSKAWPACMSCANSLSERTCQYKCSQAHHGRPSRLAVQGVNASEMTYGGQSIRLDFMHDMSQRGALSKATLWSHVWENVVNRLPRLPPPTHDRVSSSSGQTSQHHHLNHHHRTSSGATNDTNGDSRTSAAPSPLPPPLPPLPPLPPPPLLPRRRTARAGGRLNN